MPLIPIASRNASGWRHNDATALKAPIEAPQTTISMVSLRQSALIAGTTSPKTAESNRFCSHIEWRGSSPSIQDRPAIESSE